MSSTSNNSSNDPRPSRQAALLALEAAFESLEAETHYLECHFDETTTPEFTRFFINTVSPDLVTVRPLASATSGPSHPPPHPQQPAARREPEQVQQDLAPDFEQGDLGPTAGGIRPWVRWINSQPGVLQGAPDPELVDAMWAEYQAQAVDHETVEHDEGDEMDKGLAGESLTIEEEGD